MVKRTLILYSWAPNSTKVTLTLVLRFVSGPCCKNSAHATTAGTETYKNEWGFNLATVGRHIREIFSANKLKKHITLNTSTTVLDVPAEVA